MTNSTVNNNFLDKLLNATSFTANSYKIDFLPRRMGLGYSFATELIEKGELIKKNIFKAIKKVKEVKNGKSSLSNNKDKESVSNDSAEFDRVKFMNRKLKTKKMNRK
jgi:hypothetical protein